MSAGHDTGFQLHDYFAERTFLRPTGPIACDADKELGGYIASSRLP